ncbi:thiamine diphosphokinase [Oribacterium sp. WCC10]|uniref:thiamine diphosphokinase n=1 Tax=Oribacterium sp. WCC10 TaxID=1855343 RepID=UPI0008F2C39E|nr:thiamine diphosphokinase [Oribacterium sp. WCC10]SFG54319.1 thiamine pyrophosphokinase [Oribacterium sp. WCC10]
MDTHKMNTNEKKRTGRCIITGAGDFFGMPVKPQEGDYVIAADGGYENLKQCGIVPDLLVGDFDSMHIDGVKGTTGPVKDLDIYADAEKAEYIHHLTKMKHEGVETRVIDPVKNDPDMMACVRIGLEMGYSDFRIIGGTGKRMDHSIANLQILGFLAEHGCQGYMYNEKQVVTAIKNRTVRFSSSMKGYFSAMSLTDYSYGVTEKGFKYIVNDVTMNNHTPTGLSNEFVGTEAEISVKDGILLLIYDIVAEL